MGVYIKGMELPNEGVEWFCLVRFTDRTAEFFESTSENKSVCYEAVEVPAHGRLIDADRLRAKFPEPNENNGGWRNPDEALVHKTGIWAKIDAAQTVIPKEEA